MQKSNDNEIVQYLGVKHIINYLGVQVDLTQTLDFQGYLQYDVWGIWRGGVVWVHLRLFRYVHVHTYVDERLRVEGCMCLCAC